MNSKELLDKCYLDWTLANSSFHYSDNPEDWGLLIATGFGVEFVAIINSHKGVPNKMWVSAKGEVMVSRENFIKSPNWDARNSSWLPKRWCTVSRISNNWKFDNRLSRSLKCTQ